MSDNNAYLSLFIEEGQENLEQLNQSLLELEKKPGQKQTLDEIFRVAHTLKGMAAAMGFDGFKELTHVMEDLFGAFKEGTLTQNAADVDLLFQCLDSLSNDLSAIEQGQYQNQVNQPLYDALKQRFLQVGQEEPAEPVAKSSESSQELLESIEANNNAGAVDVDLLLWQQKVLETDEIAEEDPVFCVTVELEKGTPLPAVRGFMAQQALEDSACELKASFPALEEETMDTIETNTFHWMVIHNQLESDEQQTQLKKVLSNIGQVQSVGLTALKKGQSKGYVSQPEKLLEETPVAEVTQKQQTQEKETEKSTNTGGASNRTVRIPMDRIDHLVDLVGELVISRTRVVEFANQNQSKELTNIVHSQGIITNELQELVMKFRMEPIDKMFSRFPRVVRDLAKTLGKNIELKMTGEDTEVDRVVNEELSGALIHVIRNAIDHGIETTEAERLQASKPAQGTIHLSASNQGESIIITINDDGRGLNKKAILDKAIKNGLITPEKAEQLPNEEVYQLIFLPGFSTAAVTTDISGRGVGMDVVKTTTEKLGGHIEVTSEAGKGSTFTIVLPTSMAITNVLLVQVAEEAYALPLSQVKEVVELPIEEVRTVNKMEMLMVRGEPLPFIRLKQAIGLPIQHNKQAVLAVVVRLNEQLYCIEVDSLIGQQEAVVKPAPKMIKSSGLYSGVTILGNGSIVLILNPGYLVKNTSSYVADFSSVGTDRKPENPSVLLAQNLESARLL